MLQVADNVIFFILESVKSGVSKLFCVKKRQNLFLKYAEYVVRK